MPPRAAPRPASCVEDPPPAPLPAPHGSPPANLSPDTSTMSIDLSTNNDKDDSGASGDTVNVVHVFGPNGHSTHELWAREWEEDWNDMH